MIKTHFKSKIKCIIPYNVLQSVLIEASILLYHGWMIILSYTRFLIFIFFFLKKEQASDKARKKTDNYKLEFLNFKVYL